MNIDVPIINKMVSLDVSLFTKVLTDEFLLVIQEKVKSDFSLEKYTRIPVNNLMEMSTFRVQVTSISVPTYSVGRKLSYLIAILLSNDYHIA